MNGQSKPLLSEMKNARFFTIADDPVAEAAHDFGRVVEGQRLVAREAADGEGLGNEAVGDGLELA